MKFLVELVLALFGINEQTYDKNLNNFYKRMNENEKFRNDVFLEAGRKDRDNDTFFQIEAEVKNSPNYKKFKTPKPTYVPFSVQDNDDYYLHAGKITGLHTEEEATLYAEKQIKHANALCELDKANEKKKLSFEERLNALNKLNTTIVNDYYAKYEGNVKKKTKRYANDESFAFLSSDPILRRLNPRKKTAREDVLPARFFRKKL